ncbi:hypothetical protein GCG54_00011669 [Colletotrichum gloeosporioides]|uniref:Uncharacterized protein n=1 Tax=Colletotrichum gloeosporioides TaxID=474922 RepID=A0A8H4CH00_COLGL|nr:uncharacterized protein GCG54_00011669 [Colletotrichum gloeosporioides]KAF3803830.1 hypothetical protein GCG54_00011669 [Colletotrichum gloeosporioides]
MRRHARPKKTLPSKGLETLWIALLSNGLIPRVELKHTNIAPKMQQILGTKTRWWFNRLWVSHTPWFPPFVPILPNPISSNSTTAGTTLNDALWNTWSPPREPRIALVIAGGLVFQAVTSVANGPEPPVVVGTVRLQWKCSFGSCGRYKELETYFTQPQARTSGGLPTTPNSPGGHGSFNNPMGMPNSSQTSWLCYNPFLSGSLTVFNNKHQQVISSIPTYTPSLEPTSRTTIAPDVREQIASYAQSRTFKLDISSHNIKSEKGLATALQQH